MVNLHKLYGAKAQGYISGDRETANKRINDLAAKLLAAKKAQKT